MTRVTSFDSLNLVMPSHALSQPRLHQSLINDRFCLELILRSATSQKKNRNRPRNHWCAITMMAEGLLDIAVVGGSGLIGKRHCQHVIDNVHAHLCAMVDPSPSAHHVAEAFRVPLYPSVEELLRGPHKPDAAIVCTPNHTHVPVSLQLTEAGVHVLCEKPISNDIESAIQLIQSVRAHHVKLLIGHHRRFNPYMIAFKRHIDSGALGSVTAVSALWTTVKPLEYFSGSNSWRSGKGGGGVILINLIHDIDLMHYLFGPVTRVHAEKTITRRSEAQDAVEEGAVLTLKFLSGVVGTFIVSDNVASPHSFEQGTGENPHLPQSGADVYRVFGTRGTLSFPDMTLSFYDKVAASWESKITTQTLQIDDMDVAPLASQLNHFISVCKDTEQPSCTGEEGLRALLVCKAVITALEKESGGGTVDIKMPT